MRLPAPSPWKETLLFGLVLAVNLPLRLWGITDNPLALDEPFSVYHAQFSAGHIWQVLSRGNNPPVYEWILHGWIGLFGTDVFWVRLPSVLFSSLAAGFWFLAVVRFMPRWAALGVAFLFTFCSQYLYFSHEARAYPLLLLVLAVAAFFWFRLLWQAQRPGTGFAVAGTFFMALAVYVHYLALLPVAFLLGYPFIFRTRLPVRHKLGLAAATLLWLLPVAVLVLARTADIGRTGLWGTAPHASQLYGFLNIFLNGRATLAVLALLLTLGAALYLWKRDRSRPFWDDGKRRAAYTGLVFASAYGVFFGVSYRYPIFIERYVQVLIPYFFLFLGFAATCLHERFPAAKWGWFSVLGIFGWQTQLSPSNDRNPGLAAEKARRFVAHDRPVLLVPESFSPNFAYYFDRSAFAAADITGQLGARNVFALWNGAGAAEWLAAHPQTRQVMLVDAGEAFVNGSPTVLDALLAQYRITQSDSVDKATRVYYLNRNAP